MGAGVLSWQTGSMLPHFHQCSEENNFMAYIQYLLMVWWSLIEEDFLFAFSPISPPFLARTQLYWLFTFGTAPLASSFSRCTEYKLFSAVEYSTGNQDKSEEEEKFSVTLPTTTCFHIHV